MALKFSTVLKEKAVSQDLFFYFIHAIEESPSSLKCFGYVIEDGHSTFTSVHITNLHSPILFYSRHVTKIKDFIQILHSNDVPFSIEEKECKNYFYKKYEVDLTMKVIQPRRNLPNAIFKIFNRQNEIHTQNIKSIQPCAPETEKFDDCLIIREFSTPVEQFYFTIGFKGCGLLRIHNCSESLNEYFVDDIMTIQEVRNSQFPSSLYALLTISANESGINSFHLQFCEFQKTQNNKTKPAKELPATTTKNITAYTLQKDPFKDCIDHNNQKICKENVDSQKVAQISPQNSVIGHNSSIHVCQKAFETAQKPITNDNAAFMRKSNSTAEEDVISGFTKCKNPVANKICKDLFVGLKKTQDELLETIAAILAEKKPFLLVHHNIDSKIIDKLKFEGMVVCDVFLFSQSLLSCKSYTIDEIAQNLKIPPVSLTGDSSNIIESNLKYFMKRNFINILETKRLKSNNEYFDIDEFSKTCDFESLEQKSKFYEIVDDLKPHISSYCSLTKLKLIFEKLNMLDLAIHLTQTSGNLLQRTFSNQRVLRNDFFLMHECYKQKILFPCKNRCKHDKKYEGGLVLTPKEGLHENLIMLLDFNALYPSLIMEYNICFTNESILNQTEDSISKVVSKDEKLNFLPQILKQLVERRKILKDLLKKGQGDLDIDTRQKAIKLTANSMYGCLGSENSLFYNVQMASLITKLGRDTLRKACDTSLSMFNMPVIYGDTDSIMIDTGVKFSDNNDRNVLDAQKAAKELSLAINRQYCYLEIELEKVYRKLVIYAKKRYCGLTIANELDFCGMEFMKRDMPNIAGHIANEILNISMYHDVNLKHKSVHDDNLSQKNKDVNLDSVEPTNNLYEEDAPNVLEKTLSDRLRQVLLDHSKKLRTAPIEDFIINKQIHKSLESYNAVESLPHIFLAQKLAIRNKKYGKNDIVSYVICTGGKDDSLGSRAYLPEEAKRPDYDYYTDTFIIPLVTNILSKFQVLSTQEIYAIYNRKMNKTTAVSHSFINILTPCCSTTQEPRTDCKKCGNAIPLSFLEYKVHELIREQVKVLYTTSYYCKQCDLSSDQISKICMACGSVVEEKLGNEQFETFLVNMYDSFEHIEECKEAIEKIASMSSYRIVNLERYFGDQIKCHYSRQSTAKILKMQPENIVDNHQ